MANRWLMFGFGRYAIIVAVLLSVAAVIYAAAPLLRAQIPPPAREGMLLHEIPPQYRTLMVRIEREAIEAAYRQQIMRLFEGWVKDHNDQPARALRGVEVAREAFVEAMVAIDRREAELERK
jgi:hypothetical protein